MPTETKVEVTFCLTDGTKVTSIENLEDLTTFIDQHKEFVKVKHGRWLPSDKGDCIYTCSECGFVRDAYILEEKAYCPRCGARMNEVDDG